MKKEYQNILIEVININEEDIIKTSQPFGNSYPGLEDDNDLLGN